MAGRWSALWLLATVLAVAGSASGEVRNYHFVVAYMNAAPDCYSKALIAINDVYPGPTITAVQNDTLNITFENHLATEGITMHWHGIRQMGSPWADGTAAVSQCPILYRENFTYTFVVDRPGTYFYHGHFGIQRAAGFYGALIVNATGASKEPFEYDGEHMIIVNDWWHRSIVDQEEGLDRPVDSFSYVGDPQSLLLEGRGKYDCSKVTEYEAASIKCNQSDSRCVPHVMRVEFNKTYRLRLASVASLSSLNFKIENHTMEVVEADGHYIQPFVTDNLDLYSGETYSVLVKANQTSSDNFHIALNFRGGNDINIPTGLGILNYNNTPVVDPTTQAPKGPAWNNITASKMQAKQYKALLNNNDTTSHPFDNATVTRTLILLTTQNVYKGHYKWAINNVSYVPLTTPLLAGLVYNISGSYDNITLPDKPPTGYDISSPPPFNETNLGSGVYQFNTGDVVDVIIQNCANLRGHSEIHPWHLHGHDFWILGYGEGEFDPETSPLKYNLLNPPERNNVPSFPLGWTAIRFKLDNPGAWPFHCHIEWHFHLGMGVMFAHGIEEVRAKGIPDSVLGCGLTKQLFKKLPLA